MAQGEGEPEAAAARQQQGYAVELYFDPALENQVLKAWNVLAGRQISAQLIEMAARHHLTLLSAPPSALSVSTPPSTALPPASTRSPSTSPPSAPSPPPPRGKEEFCLSQL